MNALRGLWPIALLGPLVLFALQVVTLDLWRGVGRTLKVTATLLGWLVIVVTLDWGTGSLWNQATDSAPVVPEDTLDLADRRLPPTTDERVDLPAYDGARWAPRYFSELDALRYDYIPYLGPRVRDVRSRYINSQDGIRRSYEPEGDAPLEVWFFGGSTTWGEGQRDEHTIPSEVGRLAEEHGMPIQVVNMGERGYTAYQEFLLFAQRLDELGPPDLAVFFDGHNEWGVQQEDDPSPPGQPGIYQYRILSDTFDRVPAQPGVPRVDEPSIGRNYIEVSLLHKLLRRVGAIASIPAAEAQENRPVPTPAEVRAIVAVYARSVALAAMVADRNDVPVERFWQPTRPDLSINPFDNDLPAGVHDIQQAFDDDGDPEQIFIDGGHTNEVGSRLAAEAMWPYLQRTLERLSEAP